MMNAFHVTYIIKPHVQRSKGQKARADDDLKKWAVYLMEKV